jgi:hypothetical protein
MLIFAKDWSKYPKAIIDTKTKNQSFVRMASVYRSMGIYNHAFPIALLDSGLQGLDPFDLQSMTPELVMRIANECSENPWYYFREIARAPAQGSANATLFEASRGNIALFWLFFNHITQILIQPRQTGKSFSTDSLMVLLLNLLCMNTKIILLTKDDKLRRANIQRLKDIIAELPLYLNLKQPDDLNNTEEITVNARKNRYITNVPQSSEKAAGNMGRGLTTSIFHCDEGPFQPNIAVALSAALPAMDAATEKAEAEGAPYGRIFTTTAAKKDDKDGAFMYAMLENSAVWDERLFDCKNIEELRETIRRNSPGGNVRVAGVFSHRQLGKNDDWLRDKIRESNQTPEEANRDYLNIWTSGSQSSPLPIDVLEMIANSVRDVVYTEIHSISKYIVRWYIGLDEIDYRMAHGQFIAAFDTSEAGGGDDISFVLQDIDTLEVVAAGNYNETNLITFCSWLATIFIRFPNVTGIIERRSTGAMIIDYLILKLLEHGIDPFKRLFNTIVHDSEEEINRERFKELQQPMNRRDPRIYEQYKKTIGFATSASGMFSRSGLYSMTLQMAAKRAGGKMKDRTLINQTKGLVVKNGRIDHPAGGHDDMTIAWLLSNWFITQGKNLSFYGIDTTRLMTRVDTPAVLSPEEQKFHSEQQQLRQMLHELNERLKKERDEFIAVKIEQQMRVIMQKLYTEEREVFSVDEMIRKAREARKKGFNNRHSLFGQSGNTAGYQPTYRSYGEFV